MPFSASFVNKPVLHLLHRETGEFTQLLLVLCFGIGIIHILAKPFGEHVTSFTGNIGTCLWLLRAQSGASLCLDHRHLNICLLGRGGELKPSIHVHLVHLNNAFQTSVQAVHVHHTQKALHISFCLEKLESIHISRELNA